MFKTYLILLSQSTNPFRPFSFSGQYCLKDTLPLKPFLLSNHLLRKLVCSINQHLEECFIEKRLKKSSGDELAVKVVIGPGCWVNGVDDGGVSIAISSMGVQLLSMLLLSLALSYYYGIVRVYYNNGWDNICYDSYYSFSEANIICHRLGYTGG